jgi:ornithine--oxo-acid transaminase
VARLNAIKSPYIDKVTGRGLLRCVYLHETHPQGRVTAKAVASLCMERGLFVTAAGTRVRACPAPVIDETVMFEGVDILEKALDDLAEIL